jgi:hypothetical protein
MSLRKAGRSCWSTTCHCFPIRARRPRFGALSAGRLALRLCILWRCRASGSATGGPSGFDAAVEAAPIDPES